MKKMFLTLTALALAGTLSVAAPTERMPAMPSGVP